MKICFVTHNIYPLLAGQNDIKLAGGAELQQVFIGKELKKRGYTVSYISMDVGQRKLEKIDGMEIYKTYKLNEGLHGIRFLYPMFCKIWQALKKANAGLYYVRCAGFLPGIVALFCKIHDKKMVYAGAHDTDFIPSQFRLSKRHHRYLYTYGLQNSHTIITQSNNQKTNVWEHFNLESEVIRNYYPNLPWEKPDLVKDSILWVSTLRSWKRPMQFVKLAKSFPTEKFVMIGGKQYIGGEDLLNRVKKGANGIPNLTYLGFRPFHETENNFDRCKAFINTSAFEGFPNTFLQAWSRGIPVISYVDPDDVIKKYNLGLVVTSEEELHRALSRFLSMKEWDPKGIMDYFLKNHSDGIIDQYDSVFSRVVSENGALSINQGTDE